LNKYKEYEYGKISDSDVLFTIVDWLENEHPELNVQISDIISVDDKGEIERKEAMNMVLKLVEKIYPDMWD